MKHIKKNNIVGITAESENPEFPATRMLDLFPGRKFKAGSGVFVTRVFASVVGGCTDVMIAGTNASTATITATDPNVTVWDDAVSWGGAVGWGNVELDVTGTVTQDAKNNALWIELSEKVGVPCILNILLSGPSSESVNAGIVTANISESYGATNPKYGVKKSSDDTSIKGTNSNGSDYYKKRTVKRVFTLSALMALSESRKFEYFFDQHGETPTAWKLTGQNSNDYVVFGKMEGGPVISDDHLNHAVVAWTIIEVK